ncbi:MAG: VOC family protein [Balneolaceae bacterium]
MKIEHFAFNVEDPRGMADWCVEHLGLRIVRQKKEAPYLTFLADSSGRVMIEIYRDPADQVPDYNSMDPLIVHLAFVSEDCETDKNRLLKEGASLVAEDKLEDGSHMVMLRDPWGFPIQLWKRAAPMLTEKEIG